jgi:hypothetical protein
MKSKRSPFIVSLCVSLIAGLSSGSLFAQYQNGNVNSMTASPNTSAASTATPSTSIATTPATTGATPAAGTPTAAAVQKPKMCGDQPSCIITVNSGSDFLNYFGKCHDLEGASIVWKASPSIILTIKADKDAYCSMTINSTLIPDNPTVKNCTFNSNQIANMVTPSTLAAMKNYETSNGANVDKLKELMQPVMDCLGPLPTYEKNSGTPPMPKASPINTGNTQTPPAAQ